MPDQKETNRQLREDIEKIIMNVNNIQDDFIDEYLFNGLDVENDKKKAYEIRRRFSIITSALRRLKEGFIPVPHVPPYLRPEFTHVVARAITTSGRIEP
jgi:hypothetical protein